MTDDQPSHRTSEWLKVLLDEIDRRRREADEAREERQRRSQESGQAQEK